jgi:hypothetical protein
MTRLPAKVLSNEKRGDRYCVTVEIELPNFRRRKLGTPGDQTSDWVQAERELLSEIKPKRRESNLSR